MIRWTKRNSVTFGTWPGHTAVHPSCRSFLGSCAACMQHLDSSSWPWTKWLSPLSNRIQSAGKMAQWGWILHHTPIHLKENNYLLHKIPAVPLLQEDLLIALQKATLRATLSERYMRVCHYIPSMNSEWKLNIWKQSTCCKHFIRAMQVELKKNTYPDPHQSASTIIFAIPCSISIPMPWRPQFYQSDKANSNQRINKYLKQWYVIGKNCLLQQHMWQRYTTQPGQ